MPESAELANRAQLREQYATPTNLGKRASLYAYQEPHFDLPAIALELLGDVGDGPVLDVGCGPGTYLAAFAAAGVRRTVGLDQSPGMAASTRAQRGVAALVGDAGALPFADGVAAGTTALHMLYHVAEPRSALAELRRVTRPGGPILVLTNARDHLQAFRDLRNEALGVDEPVTVPADRFGVEHVGLMEEALGPVERRELRGELTVGEAGPLVDYFASGRQFFEASAAVPWPELVDRFAAVVEARLAAGPIVVHSHSAFLLAHA